jgi:hypothetical protein
MKPFVSLAAALIVALAPTLAPAKDSIHVERVQFPKGTSGTTLKGSIAGDRIVDYKLGASAGQHLTVMLTTDNTANYFNLMAPGAEEVAYYNSSVDGNNFEGDLAKSGDHTIRVYLMRSAARRHEAAHYQLQVAVTGAMQGKGTPASSGDAKVPGTEFNATGEVPCARHAGQPMSQCRFGVVREGGGSGWIKIFWPDGGSRVIFFEKGTPSRYDESQADGGAKMSVRLEADLYRVRVGDQHFEFPEALLLGD